MKLIDILKESLVNEATTSKYINRGRLNKKAVAEYLKSVIDPEHIEDVDLVTFLNNKKSKYFVISLPWFHEFLGSEWFETWKHRKPNEHFHHFDCNGLIKLLSDVGCQILHVGNDEDRIRTPFSDLPNILTIVAKKND